MSRKGLSDQSSGAALVELAVVTPVLLALAVGAGDFGRLMYTGIVLSHAARAGAQFGSYSVANATNLAGVEQAARAEAEDIGTIGVAARVECECQNLPGTLVSCVETVCPDNYGAPRVFTEVSTTFTFRTLVSFPLVPNTVSMSRTARVRVQ